MSDHAAILAAFDRARAHALPAVLATVVATRGSTYRKAGARMMLVADGTRVGVVSGGCLEADVARRAWFLKTPGAAEVVRYDTGTGDDATYEFGLGCRGVVDVLLERLDTAPGAPDPLVIAALRASIDERRTSVLAIDRHRPYSGRRVVDRESFDDDASRFIEHVEPPVQLIVFGSGVDATPVVQIARAVGWQTLLVDGRLKPDADRVAHATLAEPPAAWRSRATLDARTVAVVMTHRMTDDAGYLRDVLDAPVAYVGCLGPLTRTEALLDQLALDGFAATPAMRAKIHAPVGLDLGGERPQEIALAIVAEAQATIGGAAGGKLSMREGPIHRQSSPVDFAWTSATGVK